MRTAPMLDQRVDNEMSFQLVKTARICALAQIFNDGVSLDYVSG